MNRVLIVVSVAQEAEAVAAIGGDATIIISGIGRTNAAAAVTSAIYTGGPFNAVISAGIAGALPAVDANRAAGAPLEIGRLIVANACVYAEEGLVTPEGFRDMAAMGFSLGDFEGNRVPVHAELLAAAREAMPGDGVVGPIATVATCSGSDAAAHEIARRTGAVAEAMEGAAAVHAARRLGVGAIEVRAISNTTGDRGRQQWDIQRGLQSLARNLPGIVAQIRSISG